MTLIFFSLSGGLLLWSLIKSPVKTGAGVKFSFAMLKSMIVQIICILALLGLLLALVPKEYIAKVLGGGSSFLNVLWGALLGSITIIPGVIAIPLAGSLVKSGAALPAVAAFVTTLTMVGIATFPIEIQALGKRFTYWRNGLSLAFAVAIALLMGVLL